jgi:hypothetical protein
MTDIKYEPRAPTYAPVPSDSDEPWIINPSEVKTFRSFGTQYVKPFTKKKRSKQWKLCRLYRKAIEKYWIKGSGKKALRKILKDIYTDDNIKWTMARETKLISCLKLVKRKEKARGDNADKEVKKWVKQTMKMLKKRFNKRKLK